MTVNDFIDETIAALHRDGWKRGPLVTSSDGPKCLLMTMHCLEQRDEFYSEVVRRLYDRLDQDSIGFWNDDDGRTRDEVIELLESVKD